MSKPLFLLIAVSAAGCIVYDDGGGYRGNAPPVLVDVYASVDLAPNPYNDTLSLQATVADADGLGDVQYVIAEVYDDYTGQYVDGFELAPTSDPSFYTASWFIYDTYLIPDFYADYSIDFIVEDWPGDIDVVTVLPAVR